MSTCVVVGCPYSAPCPIHDADGDRRDDHRNTYTYAKDAGIWVGWTAGSRADAKAMAAEMAASESGATS